MSDGGKRPAPPSGAAARLLTFVSPFLPILMPVAWYLQRQAFEQASHDPQYAWPRRWTTRPLVVALVVWIALCVLIFMLFVVSAALGVNVA